MRSIVPVLLAGGGGTRLWPHSREEYPKQFLPLISERSLLVETALRTPAGEGFTAPIITCALQHRFHVASELEQAGIRPAAILTEPAARNTAPAIAAAALVASETFGPDCVLAIFPADHFIADNAAFRAALMEASALAGDRITLLGIQPQRAESGYGYIEAGQRIAGTSGLSVQRFVEKPDRATAEGFLEAGNFFWNAGIFVASAGLMLAELRRHSPLVVEAAAASVARAQRDPDFTRLDETSFASAPSISIDYAVMEKTDRAAVVPLKLEWSDVGSWYALWQADAKDDSGNVEKGDVLVLGCRDSFIQSDGGLVAALGLENTLVVQAGDATLVAHMGRVHEVRDVVQTLKQRKRREADSHRLTRRPWGSFESLHHGAKHQVKHLVLKPAGAISLQLHHHRSEHWVVVSGRARVTVDDEIRLLGPNDTAHIPLGARHRLENVGEQNLHVIEVQFGDYLGEDDIVRFEDKYRRA